MFFLPEDLTTESKRIGYRVHYYSDAEGTQYIIYRDGKQLNVTTKVVHKAVAGRMYAKTREGAREREKCETGVEDARLVCLYQFMIAAWKYYHEFAATTQHPDKKGEDCCKASRDLIHIPETQTVENVTSSGSSSTSKSQDRKSTKAIAAGTAMQTNKKYQWERKGETD
ncbi:hypothetical protein DdX_17960 [Ditylenchus destructor]|uniref:Uncharacterized protein n=1 Tax=Ditylenchus destructor TaxID=166010 RepID=A0AAD4QVB3_9BILA|nr:hypothetical protein DdX_17960 [Ditylenchus destructor]